MRICLLFFAIFAPMLAAQELSNSNKNLFDLDLNELMQIRVSVVTTKEDSIVASPAMVSRVDAAEARAYGLHSVREMLALVPGVIVQDSAHGMSTVTMRGVVETFNHSVLLLLNGTAYWNPSHGDNALLGMALEMVDHIEVIRGPGAVVYGSKSSAGVINVVTRQDNEGSLNVASTGDGEGDLSMSAQWQLPESQQIQFAVSSRREGVYNGHFMGFPTAPTEVWAPREDRAQSLFLQWHGSWWTVDSHAFDSSQRGVVRQGTSRATMHYRGYLFALNMKPLGEDSPWHVYVDQVNFAQRLEQTLAFGNDTGEQRFDKGARGNYRLRVGSRYTLPVFSHDLMLGAETETRKIDDYRFWNEATGIEQFNLLPHNSINENSLYLQWDVLLSHGRYVLGLRHINNSQFGARTLPRLAAVWPLTDRQALKLLYASGFDAPTLDQLGLQIPSNRIFGNPNLAPQVSRSAEIAWLHQLQSGFTSLTAYHLEVEDWVTRQGQADGSIKYVNLHNLTRQGLEAEWQTKMDNWDVRTAFAYHLNAGKTEPNDLALYVLPKWAATIAAKFSLWQPHYLSASLRTVSGNANADALNVLTLQWQYVWQDNEVFLRVTNALADDQLRADVQESRPDRLVPTGSPDAGIELRFRRMW